jgi:PAS domain S-box-containing protein
MEDNRLKILLLEDSEHDAELILRVIRKSGLNFIHERIDTREEFIHALKTFVPDIVLSDHSLPQFNSMEALKLSREESSLIPFVLVTGTVSEEFAVECLIEGADDYILKGNMTRLPSAILSAIKKKQIELEKNMAVDILKKSEEHFRGLIENSSDIFAIIDLQNNIEYLSPSVRKILGYHVTELKSKNLGEYVHPDDRVYTRKIVENFNKNYNDLLVNEFRFLHKNGSWRYLECISKPDTMNEYLILNIRDITERKITEQELRTKNTELEKINKELDSFVYSASHDLRAPLKSVLGLVNLTKMDYEISNFESIYEYSTLIEKSITKLDDTLQKIINYSANARSEIIYEPIEFEQMINGIYDTLMYIPRFTKIKKTVNITKETDVFLSDAARITVIFNNLISNAIKYSNSYIEDSFINVNIVINKQEAVIVFEDNGIGINESYLDKIFNMFYRATEKSDGSGLGLYIVKEVIEKLHGSIEVTSKINKGTKFTVKIPNHEGKQ